MSCRGMFVRNAVFFHIKTVSESEVARETLRFTIETGVRWCEGRRCKTAVADMVAYGRLGSDRSATGKCKCRWLNALERWLPGVAGLRMVALCYWGM